MYRKRRYDNECENCHCPLDVSEGRLCEECLEKLEEDRESAAAYGLTVDRLRELREMGRTG